MGKIIYNKGFKDLIIKKTVAPTITFIEKDASSITVTFTNNSSQEATISYGLTTPPNDDTVLLEAGATSDNVVIGGLDPDTTYTIFASANGTPENLTESDIVSTDPITTPNPFAQFTDTSGSPGATTPINDLDGNIMADLDKGIAYYGTVSHTDLYTSDQLASAVGVTQGISMDNQEVWHKYYWNGGIHFWRKPVRHSVSWNAIRDEGAIYGTGTTTSRKGNSGVGSNVQDSEVTKNGVTYAVRLMEGSSVDPTEIGGSDLHNSEFNLILMNLHAATNSGSYSNSPTDGVSYANWTDTTNYTNDDFVGWKTNLGDGDFTVLGDGNAKWQQELGPGTFGGPTRRGHNRLSFFEEQNAAQSGTSSGWAPVLTVKP